MTDPALTLKAGECLASVNHEPTIPRGYSRVEGYERFDGRPAPHEASYWLLEFKEADVEIPVGSEVTSYTPGPIPSQITGTTLTLPVLMSGSYAGGDAAGYIILVDVTYAGSDDEFTVDDVLTYASGTDWGKVAAVERESGIDTDIVTGTTQAADGKYICLTFDNGGNEPNVGDTILGASSAVSGELISMPIVTSGTWAGGDAAGFLIIVNFGTTTKYTAGENIAAVSTVTTQLGDATDAGEIYDDTNSAIYFHYLHLAQEDRRSDIEAVPGQGPVRGVWLYNGVRYAFRDKSGGASAGMYKATTAGWVEVTFGSQVGFEDATYTDGDPPAEGLLVIGASSGATGTLMRVINNNGGAWSSSNPTDGEYVLSSVTGTFQCGEELWIDNVVAGTATAAQTDNELAPGGHYEFENFNFYGSSGYYRMYFVNGVNEACEWDGTTLSMIKTGMESDKPTHLAAYAYHLFLSFPGGSLQHSSLGEPLNWTALTGAAEIGVGDEITGLIVEAEGTMTILSRNRVTTLYGTSIDDFNPKPYHKNMGALEWTAQKIGQTWYLDDRGLTTLTLTEQFGDFRQNSVSSKVEPYIQQRMTNVACSQICRAKNQYRLFFDDGTAIWGAFDGQRILGFMPVQYVDQPYCAVSVEDTDGFEYLYFGGDDGFVYQQDVGTSFDGDEIEASLMINYYHYKSPSQNKRFRGVVFEIDISDNTDIKFLPDFSYGSDEIPRAVQQQNEVTGGGGLWDYVTWDNFLWSGQVISIGRNRIDGVGSNMGLMIYSASKYLQSYNIQGATVSYSLRRLIR